MKISRQNQNTFSNIVILTLWILSRFLVRFTFSIKFILNFLQSFASSFYNYENYMKPWSKHKTCKNQQSPSYAYSSQQHRKRFSNRKIQRPHQNNAQGKRDFPCFRRKNFCHDCETEGSKTPHETEGKNYQTDHW